MCPEFREVPIRFCYSKLGVMRELSPGASSSGGQFYISRLLENYTPDTKCSQLHKHCRKMGGGCFVIGAVCGRADLDWDDPVEKWLEFRN